MVIVYRVPETLPDNVRAAFEEQGVRLLPGDRIVRRKGRVEASRELDPAIIPFLSALPVEWIERPAAPVRVSRRRGLRAGDRPAHLRLEPPAEDQTA